METLGSPSVLIVAGPHDGAAIHLREALEAKGQTVAQLDGPAASRLFTVRVGPDKTSVEPDLPMFVRASAWWYDDAAADADERFLRSEAYAAFWAAATLSRAPVINRPTGEGAVGRLTAAELRARLKSEPALAVRELHASGPELITDATDSMWGEDANFLTARVADLRHGCPLRARDLNPCALYEIVTVVGGRGFAATTDSRTTELGLIGLSVKHAREAGAHFATVTWAIDEKGAEPIRLNAAPEEQELRYSWTEVSEALWEDLLA
jgi:hypothetical protein